MKILTAAEMREVDRRTIEDIGVPVAALMENAGRAVADVVAAAVERLEGARVTVVCGRGNNGGDGLVAARHLANRGANARVVLLGEISELKSDLVRAHARALSAWGVPLLEVGDDKALGQLAAGGEGVVVDAIFGTGFRPPATGLEALAIDAIARARCDGATIVAVDLPSGLDADRGSVDGPAVVADHTVTFAAAKLAHWLPPAEGRCGRLTVADISIPVALVESDDHLVSLADDHAVARRLAPRRRDSHKGSHGHLLIVAGSRGKTGAAILAARGALRAGAGLVTVATPASCLAVVAAGCPELMTVPLVETGGGTLDRAALDRVVELAAGRDAVALGPGLGTEPTTVSLVRDLSAQLDAPVVLDADALNALAGSEQRLHDRAVLTPHPGEAGRLLGSATAAVTADRLAAARSIAARTGAVCLLKGHRSITADAAGRAWINPTGNPGLATAGTGDVLTGVVGALLAQGQPAADAALVAAHLHGRAGDEAAARLGETSVTASDVIEHLPIALRRALAP